MVFRTTLSVSAHDRYDNMAFGLEAPQDSEMRSSAAWKEAARILDISHLLDRKAEGSVRWSEQRVALGRAIVRDLRYSFWTNRFPTWMLSCVPR